MIMKREGNRWIEIIDFSKEYSRNDSSSSRIKASKHKRLNNREGKGWEMIHSFKKGLDL